MFAVVTGAGGFIGSHVAEALIARGNSVRLLVRDPAALGGLPHVSVAEVFRGDVRDRQDVAEAVKDADVIYHCAAAVGPEFTAADIYSINRDGVANLLEAVHQARRGRVVLLSSVNVLGSRDLDPATEDLPWRYSNDPAADVKIQVEMLAREYVERGVDLVVVRPGFVYGPRDRHNLPRLAQAVQRGKFVFIGSRNHVVPIVHVSDLVQALLLAGDVPTARGRTYHVTDGSRTTIGELVDRIADVLECPRPTKVLPFAVPFAACVFFETLNRLGWRRRPGPISRASLRFLGTSRYVDVSRACRELGYQPRVRMEEGVEGVLRLTEQGERTHVATGAC
jgi:nucleoside-diphosphate-sugar epimerase